MLIPAIIVTSLFSAHPLHVAYSNVEIDQENSTIEVSHKIYIQDFTLLFVHLFEQHIEPKDESDFSEQEIRMIDGYMKERFIIITGNDTLDLNYSKKQQDEETVWLFYSGKLKKKLPAKLEISNMLLLDLFMDQTNLLILNDGSTEKGITFNWDKRQETIMLNN